MKCYVLLTIVFVCFMSVAVKAQDQVILINDSPSTFDNKHNYVNKGDASLSQSSAKRLLQDTLRDAGLVTDADLDAGDFYCIIHILRWKEAGKVDKQNWYLYHPDGTLEKWSSSQYSGTRIFGSKNIALLYVHLNIPTEFENISYKVEVTKKLPAPVQSLLALLTDVAKVQGAKKEEIHKWGGQKMRINFIPSDVTVRALVPSAQQGALQKSDVTVRALAPSAQQGALQEVATNTYDNEGRYHWDVSVGVPVSKVKALEFNAQDNTIRAKEVDTQKIYVFFNFYIKPVDTKGLHTSLVPHPIIGLSLSKKPLDRIVIGGAFGLNKIEVFAGLALNKVQSPQTLQAGGKATQSQLEADLKDRYQKKFIVGLNVPVRQILDALKAKK